MDAKATWHKGLSFTGSAADSGYTLPLGADPQVGGANDGFRPLELLAVGLAGCTGMDVAAILAKQRQPLETFEVRVHADLAAEHPHVFTKVLVEYVVTGKGVAREAVERAVMLSVTKYCPVQAMLRLAAPIETKITIVDAGG
jgi:putative redox protein